MPPKAPTQLYRWAFTVQRLDDETWVTHQDLIKWLKTVADQWVFQQEKGAKGRPHFQGRLKLKKRVRKAGLLRLFVLGHGKESRACVTFSPEHHESGSFSYVTKVESRTDGPWSDRPFYSGQDLACMKDPFKWQAEIMALVEPDPDDRTIHWFANPDGHEGKTKLCKYLEFTGQGKRVGAGTATQVKTAVIASGPCRLYMVDIPRSSGKHEFDEDMFSALEEVKNGWVISPMYGKDQRLMMMPPHVIIFSNRYPNKSLISHDRWKIYEIKGKDKSLTVVP